MEGGEGERREKGGGGFPLNPMENFILCQVSVQKGTANLDFKSETSALTMCYDNLSIDVVPWRNIYSGCL